MAQRLKTIKTEYNQKTLLSNQPNAVTLAGGRVYKTITY
jgi:hypothetical protein